MVRGLDNGRGSAPPAVARATEERFRPAIPSRRADPRGCRATGPHGRSSPRRVPAHDPARHRFGRTPVETAVARTSNNSRANRRRIPERTHHRGSDTQCATRRLVRIGTGLRAGRMSGVVGLGRTACRAPARADRGPRAVCGVSQRANGARVRGRRSSDRGTAGRDRSSSDGTVPQAGAPARRVVGDVARRESGTRKATNRSHRGPPLRGFRARGRCPLRSRG